MRGIYLIYCAANAMSYVGQSYDVLRRMSRHVSKLKKGKHHNLFLQRAWDKYGSKAFTLSVIELCDEEELTSREQFWLNEIGEEKLFNQCPAAGSRLGYKAGPLSDETRLKISEALKNRVRSPEHCANISAARKGKKFGPYKKKKEKENG